MPIAIPIAAVLPDGSADTEQPTLNAELVRIEWRSSYELRDNGTYQYTSERTLHHVHDEAVKLSDGRGTFSCVADTAGSYLIRVTDNEGGASSALPLYVSSSAQEWVPVSQERPGHLDLSFDREEYQIGETAHLTIKAPFVGKALVSIESDRVLDQTIIHMKGNTGTIDIPVTAAAFPNAYCSVTLIRPVEVPHGEMPEGDTPATWYPHRAIGAIPLNIKDESRKLHVAIDAPGTMTPQSDLPIRIRVTQQGAPVRGARVTVAVVDEAICMLTRFKTPNPFAFFTRKRALTVALSDLYSLLMPELPTSLVGSPSTAAGDAPSSLASRLNPIKARRYTPMVRWVGTLETDTNGIAACSIAIPEFSGKARIMAVAAGAAGVGASTTHTIVKRPVTVTAGLPRFLAPGDTCHVPVTIYNDSQHAATIHVGLHAAGPLSLINAQHTVTLDAQSSTTLVARATAGTEVGVSRVEVKASSNNPVDSGEPPQQFYHEEIELAIRPPRPRMSKCTLLTIPAGEQKRLELRGGWLPGTTEHRVWCSPLPSVKLAGSLDYLLRYPYGCLEQTTSRAFPLLYLADLLPAGGSDNVTQAQTRPLVQAGIRRIQTMQFHDGGFAYWPRCGDYYTWGTHYATHFLVEANKADYQVDTVLLERALAYVERALAQGLPSAPIHGADLQTLRTRAYGCYILALAGKRPHTWVARLAELVRSGSVSDTESIAYLAAAQTALGMRRDGMNTLKGVEIEEGTENAEWRTSGTLSSSVKTEALLLAAWMDLDPQAPHIPLLAERMSKRQQSGRYRSTQENAMVLLALGKYSRWLAQSESSGEGRAVWTVGKELIGRSIDAAHPLQTSLPAKTLDITIDATGEAPLHCWIQSSGVPLVGPTAAMQNGLTIRRSWLNSEGTEISPNQIQRGDLVVVRLQIKPTETVRNIVISDLLPAGLEIENARLSTSQALPWAKKRTTLPIQHMEARDDRLLLFVNQISAKKEFYYVTRAVTAGTFTVPPAAAECMYDASLNGSSSPNQTMVIR